MKKALITLLLIASTGAYAQVSTQRNIFGGEDYYSNGRYLGHSAPNIHGGRDFHPSPSTVQMQRNAVRDWRRHQNSHNMAPLPQGSSADSWNWDW